MKAITTYYNGYRFRSRLEARWAVFFDALSIPYRYELQGYDVGMAYLPDFYLPRLDVHFEIKPYKPTDQEVEKSANLCLYLKRGVFLVEGDPYCPAGHYFRYQVWDSRSPRELVDLATQHSDRIEIEDIGDDYYVSHTKFPSMSWLVVESKGWSPMPIPCTVLKKHGFDGDMDLLNDAMLRARQARFEHGERP